MECEKTENCLKAESDIGEISVYAKLSIRYLFEGSVVFSFKRKSPAEVFRVLV